MATLTESRVQSQLSDVLNHLIQRTAMTSRQASTEYGIDRLGARIYDLRQMGVEIESIDVLGKNRRGHTVRTALYKLQSRVIPAAAMPYVDADSMTWINEPNQ